MTFRTIGQEEYNSHVKHTYIKKSSKKIGKMSKAQDWHSPSQWLQTSEQDKRNYTYLTSN